MQISTYCMIMNCFYITSLLYCLVDTPLAVTSVQTLLLSACFLFFPSSAFHRTSQSCLEKKDCLFLGLGVEPFHRTHAWANSLFLSFTAFCELMRNPRDNRGEPARNIHLFIYFLLWKESPSFFFFFFFKVSALFEWSRRSERPPVVLGHFKITVFESYEWPVVMLVGLTVNLEKSLWTEGLLGCAEAQKRAFYTWTSYYCMCSF